MTAHRSAGSEEFALCFYFCRSRVGLDRRRIDEGFELFWVGSNRFKFGDRSETKSRHTVKRDG
jgi:hypothetical protein